MRATHYPVTSLSLIAALIGLGLPGPALAGPDGPAHAALAWTLPAGATSAPACGMADSARIVAQPSDAAGLSLANNRPLAEAAARAATEAALQQAAAATDPPKKKKLSGGAWAAIGAAGGLAVAAVATATSSECSAPDNMCGVLYVVCPVVGALAGVMIGLGK